MKKPALRVTLQDGTPAGLMGSSTENPKKSRARHLRWRARHPEKWQRDACSPEAALLPPIPAPRPTQAQTVDTCGGRADHREEPPDRPEH